MNTVHMITPTSEGTARPYTAGDAMVISGFCLSMDEQIFNARHAEFLARVGAGEVIEVSQPNGVYVISR